MFEKCHASSRMHVVAPSTNGSLGWNAKESMIKPEARTLNWF